ncbi:MAG: PAS domain S-box protein [Candidatus Kariarchaeaceae archaeon]|jgi:PAS domain S-box-containing protein
MGEKLLNTMSRYEALFNLAPIAICVSRDDKLLVVNPAYCKLFGYQFADEVLNKAVIQFFAPEVREAQKQGRISRKNDKIAHYESIGLKSDGSKFHMEIHATKVELNDGIGNLTFIQDISDRHAIRNSLIESERKYRELVEVSMNLVYQMDTEGILTYISPESIDIFGYKPNELIGNKFTNLVVPDDVERIYSQFKQSISAGKGQMGYEAKYMSKSGEDVFLLTNNLPIKDKEGLILGIQGTAIDITERKKAEIELQNTLSRFQTLYDQSPIGIAITRGTKFIFVNPAFVKLTGYSEDELISQDVTLIQPKEIQKAALERIKRRSLGFDEPNSYEWVVKTKDGTLLDTQMDIAPIELPSGPASLSFVRDISSWKQNVLELQKTKDQLHQSQKLEAIGRITGGIAHDFKNILSVILLNIEFLKQQIDVINPIYPEIKSIQDAAENGNLLIKQLLQVSKKQELNPEIINLNVTIKTLRTIFERLFPETVEIDLQLEEELSSVNADPSQISQVIMNLVINAKDAMQDGGKLTIQTKNVSTIGRSLILLSIQDTGTGMDIETQKRIFEPYFTTKGNNGTGLGLATAYRIIKSSGGHIDVISEQNKGTAFKIFLPIAEKQT